MRLERNVDLFLSSRDGGGNESLAASVLKMKTENFIFFYKKRGARSKDGLETIDEFSPVTFTYSSVGDFEITYTSIDKKETSIMTGKMSAKDSRRLKAAAYDEYILGINMERKVVDFVGQNASDSEDFEGWVGSIYTMNLEK